MKTLDEIRSSAKLCRNSNNAGCRYVTKYRDRLNVEGASHPVLFQIVSDTRIMIIGAVPGPIDSKPSYQKLARGEFSLGHRSGQGLGMIMSRASRLMNISLSSEIEKIPTTLEIQESHLFARELLGLHVTDLVKCHAPRGWESNENRLWILAADACQSRHLAHEVEAADPEMVILLGKEVATYFSKRESWGRDRLRITKWAEQATHLPFYGKDRFITAWSHPGGTYFWIQGRKYWDTYARQMSGFIAK